MSFREAASAKIGGKFLVYGDTGTGKSQFSLTFPKVASIDSETGIATIEQRNRMFVGDEIEVFGPKKKFFTQKIDKMWDEDGNEIDVAPHPQEIIRMKMINPVENWDIIRCARKE